MPCEWETNDCGYNPSRHDANFVVTGAAPARNLLLASGGAEIWFWNGFSLTGWFDGEFAQHSTKYAGTARLRYTW